VANLNTLGKLPARNNPAAVQFVSTKSVVNLGKSAVLFLANSRFTIGSSWHVS
jgi:hypothetical protein